MQVCKLLRESFGTDLMRFCALGQTEKVDKKGHFPSWPRINFGFRRVLAEGYLERTAISLGKLPFRG